MICASKPAAERIAAAIDHAAHLLPAQGPIGVFIHQNTLHAFQHIRFEQAVCEAASKFGAEPYMSEDAYRQALVSGRILPEDIRAILDAEPDEKIWPGGMMRNELRHSMLIKGASEFRTETIQWELHEGHLSQQLRPATASELFEFCRFHQRIFVSKPRQTPVRPRDGVFGYTGTDMDEVVHPLLIKLTAAFLDQGVSYWPMPGRELGFWRACMQILDLPTVTPYNLRQLETYLQQARNWETGYDAVVQLLAILGVEEEEYNSVIEAELLALPGWAGLIHQLELSPSLAPHVCVPASLADFLAVRLLLTVAATASIAKDPQDWRYRAAEIEPDAASAQLARAATLFSAIRHTELSIPTLSALPLLYLDQLFSAVEAFGGWERRRILHLAYERRHERQILLPLSHHIKQSAHREIQADQKRRAAQVVFCIDEREESIRRHLEETDPEIETLGAAGFFSVAMHYTGIDDAHGAPLCPVVVTPSHQVKERPTVGEHEIYARRRSFRKFWATMVRHWFVSSRSLVRGALGAMTLGLFVIFPLAARVLKPRLFGKGLEWFSGKVLPEPLTELAFIRDENEVDKDNLAVEKGGHSHPGNKQALLEGFTTQEKADRVAGLLGPAGLKKGFARMVMILGHGSTSLNNPHESAHDCGACGGRRGGPNARLFAAMANHPKVRQELAARGIQIPEDTWFVGGYHDTCSDALDLYDLDQMPQSHTADLARVRASVDRARALSAHERARRFEAASWGIDATAGLHHVEERSEHLAEPRPEYGHCTNSVCIVGRRSSTRGLFFDRRAFLVSYDAAEDPANKNLAALLGAVIPVCGGISLEYYFSYVDNEIYGCGTKLPHNVTGLLGVMNGYSSDLRTGLPWQMVEIHEPVRILFVVETSPERLLGTIQANPLLWEFLSNRWIRLAAVDPAGGPILAYRDGKWEPVEGSDEPLPTAPDSQSWYKGKREHLPVARIGTAA